MSRMRAWGASCWTKRDIPRVCALLLLGCRPQVGRPFGDTLERGGPLADVEVADMTVRIHDGSVSTWGVLEVPDGSRLETAYAGVDAIARAELLKLVRVRVAGVVLSVESTDPARREVAEHTVEVVAGSLRRAGTTQHGWARVRQDGRVNLRVWARLSMPRAELEAAFRAAQAEGQLALPPGAEAELELAPSAP